MEGLLVLFLLIGAGFIALWVIIGATWFARHRRKRLRRTIMLGVAERLRFAHRDRHPYGTLPFALFQRGDGHGTAHFLSGTWRDMPATAFDGWTYVNVSDGKAPLRKYSWYSCAVTEIEADYPHLTIYPETLGTKLLDRTGVGEDLQFESEAFNRMFEVKLQQANVVHRTMNLTFGFGGGKGFRHALEVARAQDPRLNPMAGQEQKRFAYAFIDARMMQWLLETQAQYRFEVFGRYLFVAAKQATDLAAMLDALRTFKGLIPRAASTLFAGTPTESVAPPAPVPATTEPAPVPDAPPQPRNDAQLGWADDDPRLTIRPEDLPLAPDDPRIPKLREVITDSDTRRLLGIE